MPIPASERALQTAEAESWFKVSDEGRILEGAIFDRSGNLLSCVVSGRRVLRLTPNRQLSTVVTLAVPSPGGLAFHPDGRMFIAALDIPNGRGAIYTVRPRAWPSTPEGTTSTPSPATPTRDRARRCSTPRRSARGCRLLHPDDSP